MSVIRALAHFGCTASINGAEPATSEEYADEERVVIHTGDRPAWSDVFAKAAEFAIDEKIAAFSGAIQRHIDAMAKTRNYDSGASLASYSNSTIKSWAAEASAFITWRDSVWSYAYSELEKVKTGKRPAPSVPDIIGELPTITWP